MAGTVVPNVMVNLKALNRNNYRHWSFRMKTYLLAEDLWDVVEDTNDPPKLEDGKDKFMAWRKNNARALHAITISCGEDAESFISDIERAKDAWNTLAEKFKTPEILEPPEENYEVDPNHDADSIDGDADLKIQEYQVYARFFRNVRHRNWNDVKEFIKQHPEAVRAKDYMGKTALHQAILREDVNGVKELLPLMKNKDLEILDHNQHTPLSLAIRLADTDVMTTIIKCIVEKNKKLLLHNFDRSTTTIPLFLAMSLDKPKVALYLYYVTPVEKLKNRDRAQIISMSLRLKRLDIPLDLIRRFPSLALAKDHSGESPLSVLVSARAGLFLNASQLGIWERWIYNRIYIPPTPRYTGAIYIYIQQEEEDQGNRKHLLRKVACFFGGLIANFRHLTGIDGIYQMKLLHVRTIEILRCMCQVLRKEGDLNYMQHKFVEKALFQAVERGNAPFIRHIMTSYPRFLAITNEHDKTIFQFAVENRQEKIFNLIHRFEKQVRKDIVSRRDKFGNNMLHVVGKLSLLTHIAHIRGAALQMQSELQWFKKLERMADPEDLNCINSEGQTPRVVFTMNHRELVKEGELSMKETATSSSALVAALIITVMFAAAVTVPGGSNENTGIPIYLNTKAFSTFIVADVVSLCASTTSVMVFLGILTSRFAEEDFLLSLPTKLIIGFLTLFLSIGAMMIAFSSAIFIMLPEKTLIVISTIVLTGVPIASFLWMQFPFLLEIIVSTYFHSIWKDSYVLARDPSYL